MLNDFLTLDHTFRQFYDLNTELDLHRITSGFYGTFATDVTCQQGTLPPPPGHLAPSLVGGLEYALIVETSFPNAESILSILTWHENKASCIACSRFFKQNTLCSHGSLCRLRSIATHRDNFVRLLSVRLSVCPFVRLSVYHTRIAMFRRRHMHSSECCHYFFI